MAYLNIPTKSTGDPFTASELNDIVSNIQGLQINYIKVNSIDDFPTPINGVITLESDKSYLIATNIDLGGNRLVGGSNSCLVGVSSENSSITSTGLNPLTPLFTSQYTTPMRHFSFINVGTCFDIDGLGNNAAFDWTGINLINIPNLGVMKNFTNLIITKCAVLNSNKLVFDGSFDTVGIEGSLLSGNGLLGSLITIPSTATVNRRFRITYSAVVSTLDTTAISVSDSASIPVESYILDTVNFSGGGTYLSGVDYSSNKALFTNSKNITNSREVSQLYMKNNAIPTVVSATSTPVKVLGSTTNGDLTSKFANTDNRSTYEGAITRIFKITSTLSVQSGNNNQIGCYIAKNGSVLEDSEIYSTTSGTGKAEDITIQSLVNLSAGDFIEVFVENKTSVTNITVTDLNTIIF